MGRSRAVLLLLDLIHGSIDYRWVELILFILQDRSEHSYVQSDILLPEAKGQKESPWNALTRLWYAY
jgi:hypothetical protein